MAESAGAEAALGFGNGHQLLLVVVEVVEMIVSSLGPPPGPTPSSGYHSSGMESSKVVVVRGAERCTRKKCRARRL